MHLFLLGRLLRVGNGLLAALPGTGVVLGALSADGEAVAVTDASVATDIHETLDVHLDGGAEFALDLVVLADLVTDGSDLLVVPLAHLDAIIDAAFVKDLLRGAAADSEDIGKAYLSSFVVG